MMPPGPSAPDAAVFRRLRAADAGVYRDLRLEGLAAHPEAFGASWEEEAARPTAWFAGRLQDDAVFGAWDDGPGLAGAAGLRVPGTAKLRHKGALWGMYVRPRARGTGLAVALLVRVLEHARGHVEEVRLTVAASNAAALRLYRATGFEAYGVEPRALKVDGGYHDEVLMALRFLDDADKRPPAA